jgi:uncharacterized protein (TIRG00374 family)
MKKTLKYRLFSASSFRSLISVALIVTLVWNIDRSELVSAFSTVSAAAFLVLVLIELLLRLLSAYRWHVLFVGLQKLSPVMEITRISFIASFLGQALPGAIGVEALRIYGLTRASGDAAAAFASVVADRIFGLLSLVLVIFAGLIVGPQGLQEMVLVPASVSLIIVFVLVFLLMNPHSRRWSLGLMPAALREKVRHWIADVFSCLDRYKNQPRVLIYSLALSILFQVLRVSLFYSAAVILGESPSFVFFLALVPIVMFAALLPISIGGLGVREASLVVLFSHFGVMDSTQAFVVAILVFVAGLISLVPGAWFYVAQRKEIEQMADQV